MSLDIQPEANKDPVWAVRAIASPTQAAFGRRLPTDRVSGRPDDRGGDLGRGDRAIGVCAVRGGLKRAVRDEGHRR